MKFFKHGLALFVLSLGMVVFVGCGTDNDSDATNLAKAAGDPGKPDPKSVHEATGEMPKSPEEHYANQQKNDSLKQGAKYPGPKQK